MKSGKVFAIALFVLVAGYFLKGQYDHKQYLRGIGNILRQAHQLAPFDSNEITKKELLDGFQSLNSAWENAIHAKGYTPAKDDQFFVPLSDAIKCFELAALVWKAKDDEARGELQEGDIHKILFGLQRVYGEESQQIINADGTGIRGCLEPQAAMALIRATLDIAKGHLKLADLHYNSLTN